MMRNNVWFYNKLSEDPFSRDASEWHHVYSYCAHICVLGKS